MQNTPKLATLCFLIKHKNNAPEYLCLAMKKRGFGEGKWNGAGGKVLENENIEEAVARETYEEFGVFTNEIKKVAKLTFLFPHMRSWDQIVHVYIAHSWEGQPSESEEMKPEWFHINEIPFDNMWESDVLWIPKILEGNKVEGTILFGENEKVLEHNVNLVQNFSDF